MKKKLLDITRDKIRLKHYSYKTEKSYTDWIKKFLRRHNTNRGDFTKQKVSLENQAFNALLFLYTQVLGG